MVSVSILPNTEVGNKDSINFETHRWAEIDADTQDLLSVWISFLISYLDCKPEDLDSQIDGAKLRGLLSSEVIMNLKSFLANPNNFDLSLDYLKGFGLDDVERITEIPVDLANEWSISRGYMSATVSRLKSAGVAEDYGKKIRLTSSFVAAWNNYS